MTDMSLFEITIIGLAVCGSAVIKTGVGVGAGIFMLPLLALVFPPKVALGLGAPALLLSDITGLKNYWKEWDTQELIVLVPFALLGGIIGIYIINITPEKLFRQGIAVFALTFASFHLSKAVYRHWVPAETKKEKKAAPAGNHRFFTAFFGCLTGIAGTLAHAAGITVSLYMFQKNLSPRVFVANLLVLFTVINVFKTISYMQIGIITPQLLTLVLLFSPGIIICAFVGNFLNKNIPQDIFRLIVLVLIFLIGLRLL